MNKLMLTYLTMALFAMILNDVAWARGGGGHGGGHGGGGGHSAGGGGHRHAGGGHRHFRGGHRHHRHNHFNLGFGIGGYNSGFYGSNYGFGYGYHDPFFYPRPYYGSTVVVPMTPPIYIQREEARPLAQPQTNYWHYCQNPDGYYPYVKQCPGGWLQVAPQPLTQ